MLIDFTHYFIFILLFFTGLFAGTIDAIAGGGGLITLPVLLGVGVPPHIALGTSKFQSSFGTSIATFSYYRRGFLEIKKLLKGLFFSFIGAVLGAVTIQHLDSSLLKKIIPLFLMIILLYTLFSPRLGHIDKNPKINETWFYVIFGTLMGFYDGFFGPGAGSFWVFLLIFFLGYNVVKATAFTKAFNLNTNLAALCCFVLGNNIDYKIGICMASGQLIGGRIGAVLAMNKGGKIIRPIFILVVSGTMLSLLYKNFIQNRVLGMESIMMFVGFVILILVGSYYLLVKKTKNQSEPSVQK